MIWSGSDILYSFQTKITSELSFVQPQNQASFGKSSQKWSYFDPKMSKLCGIVCELYETDCSESFFKRFGGPSFMI